MTVEDADHPEACNKFPAPLALIRPWNLGARALPATLLSASSALVFAVVLVSVQVVGTGQSLFVLPRPGTFVIGLVAAAISWGVASSCRGRPGSLWPRIWALALACSASVIAVMGLWFPDWPWSLALAVSTLAAALALAPRLIKLRPHSAMVQFIAPLSLVLSLLFAPAAHYLRATIARRTEESVHKQILQLRAWTRTIHGVTGFDWARMEDHADAAAARIGLLAELDLRHATDDAKLWHAAVALGKERELLNAMQELTETVTAGFAPDRVPKISDLREPAIWWNEETMRWNTSKQFRRCSELVGEYHHQLGRLFDELAPLTATPVHGLVAFRQYHVTQRGVLKRHLETIRRSWVDQWVVDEIPGHAEITGRAAPTIEELLHMPFAAIAGQSVSPAQVFELLALPANATWGPAPGSPQSLQVENPKLNHGFAVAPGCQRRSLVTPDRQYLRITCYAYKPRHPDRGAELQIVLRIVYQSAAGQPVASQAKPAEILYMFVVPESEGSDDFRQEVMTSMASATRELAQDSRMLPMDRGASFAGGFTIQNQGFTTRLYRPFLITLTGLAPERRALMVRAVPAP